MVCVVNIGEAAPGHRLHRSRCKSVRLWSFGRLGRRLVWGRGLRAGMDVGGTAPDIHLRHVALSSPPPCRVEVLVSVLVIRAIWSSSHVWGAVLSIKYIAEV